MGLISDLQNKDKKKLFNSNDSFTSYCTGLAPLDYANGFLIERKNENGELNQIPVLGIVGGTFITIIGLSGSGKTTLAEQIGWQIVSPFSDGIMMHVDVEKTALKHRICEITGASEDDPRIILNKDHVSIEDVLEIIDDICTTKEEGKEEYKYVLPKWAWSNPNKEEKAYVPSVIIIDSIPAFNSRERKEEELEGQTTASREAGQIAQFYTKCLNKMYKYNITIITINHIKAKIDINRFQASPPQFMMLKQGESLPRGNAPIYYAQNIFRCNATKGNMYTIEDNGFEGFMAQIQIAKTKTSFIGSTLNVAFNKDIGYDPIYTLYEFGCQAGIIEGRNPNLYFKGLEAFKFNRKKFRDKFISEEEFRNGVMRVLQPYLNALIGSKDMLERERDRYIPIDSLLVENESGKIITATIDNNTGEIVPVKSK